MTAIAESVPRERGPLFPPGRHFVSPSFDWLMIAGGLGLIIVACLYPTGHLGPGGLPQSLLLAVLLLVNSTHFAASTVRLYTKPGAFRELPVMTMVLPAVSVGVLALALVYSSVVGLNLFKLYLTWSPYHYAAQTFGLASMYAARSGMPFDSGARKLLWLTCMLPFATTFVGANDVGLGWFLPPSFFLAHPELLPLRSHLVDAMNVLVFAAPVALLGQVYLRAGRGIPPICLFLILSNGAWWILFPYVSAFVWATVSHGLQYLAIVIIFHVRDHPDRSGRWPAWVRPTAQFYVMSLALGYALFELWPYFWTSLGFSFAESALLCVAVINIHHFIVDRGIWQIRKDAANRRAMTG